MGTYIFALATIIAVIPILFIFKVSIERIKENPKEPQKILIQFILWVAIFEVIPIILVIYGMAKEEVVTSISELYMPGMIILLITSFAAFFIFLQMKVDVERESKEIVQRFCLISFMLVMAIPLLSVVGLLLMVPTT